MDESDEMGVKNDKAEEGCVWNYLVGCGKRNLSVKRKN